MLFAAIIDQSMQTLVNFNSIGCCIVLGYEGPDSDLNATAPREMLLCGRGKDYILTAPSVAKEFPPCIYCMFYF